jgi:serine/threonine-protein kinase RsbW
MSGHSSRRIFRLEVPGDPKSLALIRLLINHLAASVGYDEVESTKVEIAVDEACANIIEHGYSGLAPKPPIQVSVDLTGDDFVVEITDEGKQFNIDNYTPPTFPEHWDHGHTRGVGIFLMNQCMDQVSFGRADERHNQLRMTKKLKPHSSPATA